MLDFVMFLVFFGGFVGMAMQVTGNEEDAE